ncbi:hypothetical protein ACFLU6_14705 [Acidobacteriota bacterium]
MVILEKPGVVAFSIDMELAWGCFYKNSVLNIRKRLSGSREILKKLLHELSAREISMTWVVGHLFLSECSGQHGQKEPLQDWFERDWYSGDPGTDLTRDPEWYGADMVRSIRECRPAQEIGAHGFSHCFLDDPAVTDQHMEIELQAAVEAAAKEGVKLESFVFPKNRISRTGLLKEAGFVTYRAQGKEMGAGRNRGIRDKLMHLFLQATGTPPQPEQAWFDRHGMLAVPGTCLYLSTAGWRAAIPIRMRVRRAVKGMERAALKGGLFHLWFHLEDFLESKESYFAGLRKILARAAQLRDDGKIRIMTMAQMAKEVL